MNKGDQFFKSSILVEKKIILEAGNFFHQPSILPIETKEKQIMKSIQIFIIAAYCFIGHYGFSQNSEIRELAPFTKIKIKNNASVILKTGSPQEVRIESKNSLNQIETKSEEGSLSLDGPSATLYITLPELNSITISGVGKVRSDSTIRTNSLRISISGDGKVNLPIDVNRLEIGISGIGKLELSGKANTVETNISGSGKIEAADLQVSSCEANISGVGKCFMDVRESLSLRISGSGSFYYKTKPASINTNISGIGKYGNFEDENNPNRAKDSSGTNTVIGHQTNGTFDDDDDDDEFSFNWVGESYTSKDKKARSHWAGLDLGFNQLMTDNFDTNIPDGYDFLELNSGNSINVNINFFALDLPLYRRHIMFTTGLGLTLNNYRFTSDKTLIADTNRTVADYDFDKDGNRINYEKNKLAVNYITAPFLLQFNTKEKLNNSFHFAVGMLLSYKYNSHLKLVYNDDGDKEKSKRQDEFNIAPFRYDATVRIGYEYYTLYASYSLDPLFKEGRGPSLYPFQVGINLFGW